MKTIEDSAPALATRTPRRRASLRLLCLVAAITTWPAAPAFGDVVPPRAVEVADAWLAAVERGRVAEAVERWFDDPSSPTARAILAGLRRRPARSRTIRSWTAHGDGDVSQMPPGSYHALVFDTVDADGRCVTDEIRLVPRGNGDWRVVGDVRS